MARSRKMWTISEPNAEYSAFEVQIVLARKNGAAKIEKTIGASCDVADLMRHVSSLPSEHLFVILCNTRNQVLGIHDVAGGGLCMTVVEPKQIFQAAILSCAAAIVLVHNHPSGNPEPSSEDIALTRTMFDAGTLLGFRVLDHVIIGTNGNYVSLADRGLI